MRVVLLLLGLLVACSLSGPASAPVTLPAHHHPSGGFRNPHVENTSGGALDFLARRLFGDDAWAAYDPDRDGAVQRRVPRLVREDEGSTNARVTWIGQATVLIQHAGVNVLTDPIFSNAASPVRFVGPVRMSAPGLAMDQMPRVDVVALSHDHYDHLDAPTIRALGDGPRYFVPLGLGRLLRDEGISPERIVELDWWEAETVSIESVPLKLTATPSQHVSGRSVLDRNDRLWAAWAVEWPDFKVWFGGDTGYNDVQFKEIGDRFGGFDLGIVPIGSYAPREYMRAVHLDPAEAVRVHQDIRAVRSMAVHWGTFHLTAEPFLEPPLRLREALQAAGLESDAVTAFAIGESRGYMPR